jgi:5-methylcytosine-specific restriction endonuclease McrBC regulatory subunit McrC
LIALLIGAFLERVRDYVARGVDFEYRRREEVGSLVGGPINVAKTVQLRAKGMRYSAAFFRPILRRDLPKNKVVLAALRQVELLARSVDVPSVDIATSRSLAHFFAESQDIEIVLGRREAWSAEARRLETEARGVADQDLLALAAVILSHESFEPEPLDSAQHVPRSWFVNLENLFERAARRALSRAILGRSQVTGPGSLHPPIFEGVTGRFRANPDFVVRTGAVAVAVGDAKYKTWRGLETKDIHGDLYQLLVHSAAHGSPVAFLLFAHNEFAVRHLGRSGTGADTWAFALDVRALDRDLSAALDLLGL